jgi:hypothetical protein
MVLTPLVISTRTRPFGDVSYATLSFRAYRELGGWFLSQRLLIRTPYGDVSICHGQEVRSFVKKERDESSLGDTSQVPSCGAYNRGDKRGQEHSAFVVEALQKLLQERANAFLEKGWKTSLYTSEAFCDLHLDLNTPMSAHQYLEVGRGPLRAEFLKANFPSSAALDLAELARRLPSVLGVAGLETVAPMPEAIV